MESVTIKVFSRCPHGCNERWFSCHLRHGTKHIATYACGRDPEEWPYPPTDEEVAEVRRLHPGADLVY